MGKRLKVGIAKALSCEAGKWGWWGEVGGHVHCSQLAH